MVDRSTSSVNLTNSWASSGGASKGAPCAALLQPPASSVRATGALPVGVARKGKGRTVADGLLEEEGQKEKGEGTILWISAFVLYNCTLWTCIVRSSSIFFRPTSLTFDDKSSPCILNWIASRLTTCPLFFLVTYLVQINDDAVFTVS